ncbi:MAG: leucine--tRNA ligase [Patescibacteria group bacterium]
MRKYDHEKIEKKWQKKWEEACAYETPDAVTKKKNEYVLVEFPYPSGNLHTGHWYAFSIPDIYVRMRRMQGHNVLFPIGFDAFGLPAENAAITHNVSPKVWTEDNMQYMEKQLRSMGASFDWSRMVRTCDPEYYKWTQWFFLQFYKNGLAYQADTQVNWCPSCKTVLANEQVQHGTCERCSSVIEQRNMRQWMFRITQYGEKLLEGLDELNWPNEIKEAQRNWIGKSEGARVTFKIVDNKEQVPTFKSNKNIEVGTPTESVEGVEIFTTRPDTIFGATYLVLAPEHPVIESLMGNISNLRDVRAYQEIAVRKTQLEREQGVKDKTGIQLEGISAINPATEQEIPVWISDYVLANYGTGAIMAVPAHDARDFAFAAAHQLPVVYVVHPESNMDTESFWEGDGTLINSGAFTGQASTEARSKMAKEFGETTTQYRLRDWVLSRQRYWGAPIPMIHCASCGVVPVPEDQLPVILPEVKDFLPTGDGKSPLAKAKHWVHVPCPTCGADAERETDTMDTFVDSSWYFLRYTDPHNTEEFASKKKMAAWMPVDMYSGGAEHTTMHLLYSRFFTHVLADLKLIAWAEPFTRRMNRGLILGPDGQKMSKSKGNVIDPDAYVQKLGGDTVRMYLAFIGPFDEVGAYPWDPNGILGMRKFLDRVWRLAQSTKEIEPTSALARQLHLTIKKIGEDIEKFKFNTCIAELMKFVNALLALEKEGIPKSVMQSFTQLLAPFAPHLAEEMFAFLGGEGSVHARDWPTYDADIASSPTFTLVVQRNGKKRGIVEVDAGISKDDALNAIVEAGIISKEEVLGATNAVYVSGRLINIVVT